MATAGTTTKLVDKLTWYTSKAPHQVWDRFPADEKERMLEDDLAAGVRVSLVLTALIAAGMLLSIATVLAVVFLQ
jgi:hypothetical protein